MAFLSDITLGQYYEADSFVHRLDPRNKFITCLISMSCLLIIKNLIILFVLAIFILLSTKAAKLPPKLVIKNIRPFIWLLLLTFFINLFWSEGKLLWQVPLLNISIYSDGIIRGLLYSLRLMILIVLAALLTLTTSPIDLTDALDKLTSPGKKLGLPTHELTMMITLALRFIPTLLQEAERIKKAQISRGASFEGNLIKKIKSVIPMIIPLFLAAFRRADELALAMDSRCYTGGEGRTCFTRLAFKRNDYFVLIGSLILGSGFILIEYIIL